jgi:2'-5' RNA ligase
MSLFVGLLPSGVGLAALRSFERVPVDGVRWEPERRWHVTLRYSALSDESTKATLLDATDEMAALFAPPLVTLGPSTERLGRDGTLVVPAQGVDELADALDEALVGRLGARDEPFYGHLTLARLRRSSALPEQLVGRGIETSFTPGSAVLIESSPGPEGSAYDLVHHAPFGGAVA